MVNKYVIIIVYLLGLEAIMGTILWIGIKQENGSVSGVYCRSNGFVKISEFVEEKD
jgi:hypothetical protein